MESVCIICDKSPFGTNTANESLRLAAGFLALGDPLQCKLILINDGVLLVKKGFDAKKIGTDSMDEPIEMMQLTEMPIAVIKEDLKIRGIADSEILEIPTIQQISAAEIPAILSTYDFVFHV